MKKGSTLVVFAILTGMALPLKGQTLPEPALEIHLYEGVAPGSEHWDWTENLHITETGLPIVQNVVDPVLQYYPADRDNAVGTAIIVAPGGGFENLMMSYEGVDIAKRLNEMGVDAFVLKYRLINKEDREKQSGQDLRKMAGADGQQAVRLIRARAREFGIKSNHIGIMGFSAGGHVALATVMGPPDGRPDFAAPVYAATGSDWGQPLVVPDHAAPLFIATAADDQLIPWERSMELFAAWRNAGIPAELHIFQTGAHGFVKKGGGADHFMDRLEEWMLVNDLLK
jgi:acetyl esterase/lipase